MDKSNEKIFTQLDIWVLVAFFVSFFHSILGMAFLLLLAVLCFRGVEWCVKCLLLVTTRGIISFAVAASMGGSVFKLAVVFIASFLIFFYTKNQAKNQQKTNDVLIVGLIFSVYAIFSSFLNATYPITAAFKVVSFIVPFAAILRGVAATREYKWSEYFVALFGILFAISFVLIPFGRFRIVNDDFQGVFNHVNSFGIVSALYIAMILHSNVLKEKKKMRTLIVIAMLIMCWLSASRTGLFTSLAVIAVYYAFGNEKKTTKILVVALVLFLITLFVLAVDTGLIANIRTKLNEFIYKNGADNIWASREETILIAKEKYKNNPLFGSGFMVPFTKGEISFGLDFSLVVEPGNIIWSILGDTGIIGIVLFSIFLLTILVKGQKQNVILIIAAFFVNMGEMVFFSSNNMSILIWFLIALYISPNPNDNVSKGTQRLRELKE